MRLPSLSAAAVLCCPRASRICCWKDSVSFCCSDISRCRRWLLLIHPPCFALCPSLPVLFQTQHASLALVFLLRLPSVGSHFKENCLRPLLCTPGTRGKPGFRASCCHPPTPGSAFVSSTASPCTAEWTQVTPTCPPPSRLCRDHSGGLGQNTWLPKGQRASHLPQPSWASLCNAVVIWFQLLVHGVSIPLHAIVFHRF